MGNIIFETHKGKIPKQILSVYFPPPPKSPEQRRKEFKVIEREEK